MISPRLPFIRSCIVRALSLWFLPALAGNGVLLSSMGSRPHAGSADVHGEVSTRNFALCPAMTVNWGFQFARKIHASIRLNTSVALVPPKPKEFDSTVPSLALSMRLRTIGMSANTGSSSVMLALSQMKPLFIISSE